MRLLAYDLLTQAIILLGCLRGVVARNLSHCYPPGRVFDVYDHDSMECCDCGLVHHAEYFGPDHDCGHQSEYPPLRIVGHMFPWRPAGYRYQWRYGAGRPSLAVPSADGQVVTP